MIGRALGRAPKPSTVSPYICSSCLSKQYYARHQTRRESTAATASEDSAAPVQKKAKADEKHVDASKRHASVVRRVIDTKRESMGVSDVRGTQTAVKEKGTKEQKGGKRHKDQKIQNKPQVQKSGKGQKGQKGQRPQKAHSAQKDQDAQSEKDGKKTRKKSATTKPSLVQTIKAALEAHQRSLKGRSEPTPKVKPVKKAGKQKPPSQRTPAAPPADTPATVHDTKSGAAEDRGQRGQGRKSGASIKEAMLSKSKTPAKVDLEGNIESMSTEGFELTPLQVEQPPVPHLSYGLDRVLFNPGVYYLQDERSRVYNFDPYLQKVMPVAEFDFNALTEYITSSKDVALRDIAKQHGRKYIGSTSSMTGALSQFHFLLSQWRPVNTQMLSSNFSAAANKFTQTFTAPSAIFLRWKDGVYAIDADKQFDTPNILSMLGKSLEKLLTLPKEQYERYRVSSPDHFTEEPDQPESYHYSVLGDFLMRSQLDAYDPRLPGTGMFDLKTRAVVAIRMHVQEYEQGSGYQVRYGQGKWESFEREYYDMMRATALKYSLQVRMGRMDGIFVAYHNVERIFGFQYIALPELDQALHGQTDLSLGNQEFAMSLQLLNQILNRATEKFPGESIRLHFETREGRVPFMYVFAEPVSEVEADAIQNTNKEKVEEFERSVLGLNKQDETEPDGWTDINAAVEEEMELDELSAEDLEVEPDASFEEQFATVDGFAQQLFRRIAGFKRVIDQRKAGRDLPKDPDDDLEEESSKLLALAEQLSEKTQQLRDDMHNHEEENARLTDLIDRVSELIDQHKDDRARLSTLDGSEDQDEEDDEPLDGKEQANELEDEADEDAEEDDDEGGVAEDEGQGEDEDKDQDEGQDEDEEEDDTTENADTEDANQEMEEQNNEEGRSEDDNGQPNIAQLSVDATDGWAISDAFVPLAKDTSAAATRNMNPEDDASDEPSKAADDTNDSALSENVPAPPTVLDGVETSTDAEVKPPRRLLGMTLTIRNKVNGKYVVRPEALTEDKDWTIEYVLKEIDDDLRVEALYETCRARRKKVLNREEKETDAGLDWYRQSLMEMSRKGREWRKAQDLIDEKKEVVVWQPLETPATAGKSQPVSAAEPPQQERVEDVDSYLDWLYKR